MNKKLLLSGLLVVLTALMVCNLGYAIDSKAAQEALNVKTEKAVPPPGCPLDHPKFSGKHHPNMMPSHPFPSKAEMEDKKAEIDKRLNLTDEQKQKLEKIKEKDRAKIKPVIDKMHAKKAELHKIYTDDSLSKEQKDKKAAAVKKDLNKLRVQADNCRKENMKNFESVLTPEQKTEFGKIKEEQKAEMKKRRAEFEQKRKEFDAKYKKQPVQPLPVPNVEK